MGTCGGALLGAFALAGCGPSEWAAGDEPFDTGTHAQPIVGGVAATGDPAVVALTVGGSSFCTGTLVAPQTVVTAAHCVYSYGTQYTYSVYFGSRVDPAQRGNFVAIERQIRHPEYQGAGNGRDIAVLKLQTPVTTVTPIPINTAPLSSSSIGAPIRHVGYGITGPQSQSSSGQKREVTYTVRQVGASELESGAQGKQTCSGDSGGPGLMVTPGSAQERLAGVVSYGDQYCRQMGVDVRVDVHQEWLRQTFGQWEQPSCEKDARCRQDCAQPDVDCLCAADGVCGADCPLPADDPDCPKDCGADGVCSLAACPAPDPDCRTLGEACTNDLECKDRQCLGDRQHEGTYCSRSCTSDEGCPEQMSCVEGACRWPQRPEATVGEPCTAETFCLEGTACLAPLSGEGARCAYACTASCPSSLDTCVPATNGDRLCARPGEPVVTPVTSAVPGTPATPAAPGPTALRDEGSGCSVAGGGAGAYGCWALLLALERWRSRRTRWRKRG